MMEFKYLWILFFVNFIQAQSFELDNVTKFQLEEKIHSKDTSSVAAILFKKAKTIFNYDVNNGFSTVTEFSIKIKIYKKEGLDWANFEIPYYIGFKELNDEQVDIIKAYTYNIEEGKVVKQKVTSEGKFKDKINEFWATKIITFPNVKVGSIIELKYQFKSENLSELPVFQYQYKIPVDYAQFITEVPGLYLYKTMRSGFVEIKMDDQLKDVSYNFQNKYGTTTFLSCKSIKTTYEAKDVPGLIKENFVSNINNYYGKIENELQTVQYPDEPVKQIAKTWEDVAKSIYQEKTFGDELKKTSYYQNDLKRIIDTVNSKEERLNRIFSFVKNKMNWNGKYGYYSSNGVEKAYIEETGNVADINFILVSMLKMGGLDANPVLISTKENGVALFPNRSKFNYVIVSVKIDDQTFLLDATNKFSTFNIIPLRDLNYKGRLIQNDGSSLEIDLMPKKNSSDLLNMIVSIDPKGGVKGQFREQFFDYYAFDHRNKYGSISNESYIEKIEKKFKGLEIENFERSNDKKLSEPVIEKYSFKSNNSVEIISDKMYFNPMIFLEEKENPFKQETRLYPIDFNFSTNDKYIINITIPEGYQIESLPAQVALSMPDNYGTFKYLITNTDNMIQVVVSLDINSAIIPSDYYATLKEFFKKVVEKENEKVVLKKI